MSKRKTTVTRTEYPESKAIETWVFEGLVCSITRNGMGALCGYVRFPKRPVSELGYDGIIGGVRVHGGVTYAKQFADGSMVYGFDCSHSGDRGDINETEYSKEHLALMTSLFDPSDHLWTVAEVRTETEQMVTGIKFAAMTDGELYA